MAKLLPVAIDVGNAGTLSACKPCTCSSHCTRISPEATTSAKVSAQLHKADCVFFASCRYDPKKVFEPLLMQKVINRAPNTYSPKCDLRRTCYCKDDSHCADGFACVASYALPEYKVCKPIGMRAKFG